MNEEWIAAVADAVRERLTDAVPQQPAALLLGRRPARELGWRYVTQGEYAAVVIGSLGAAELLRFPDEACAQALLEGKPVYLCEDGLDYRRYAHTANRALWCRLLAAERQMKQLGVRPLGDGAQTLLTAEEVRRRLRQGQPIGGRLTPLARDVLEGKA